MARALCLLPSSAIASVSRFPEERLGASHRTLPESSSDILWPLPGDPSSEAVLPFLTRGSGGGPEGRTPTRALPPPTRAAFAQTRRPRRDLCRGGSTGPIVFPTVLLKNLPSTQSVGDRGELTAYSPSAINREAPLSS